MSVSIKEINDLRKITGAGLMNCKKALLESEGNIKKAIEYLRKNGIKVANKRIDCVNNEGCVLADVNKTCDFGAIVSVFCETDFVAKNEIIQTFLKNVLNIAINKKVEDLEVLINEKYEDYSNKEKNDNDITVKDCLDAIIGVLHEKIELKYTFLSGENIGFYNHFNNKISVLLEVKKYNSSNTEILKNIAMQIAAMNPIEVKRDDVSAEIVNREFEIAKELSKEAKTAEIAEKMAKGKLEKFFKEKVLLEQPFIFDEKKSVLDYIKENGNFEVLRFKKVSIEK